MANEEVVFQTMSFFSPASYNLPMFKFSHLPATEVRTAWTSWIRWFDNVMLATNILESHSRKAQMLAMGGMELQSVFYGIPGADIDGSDGRDPYIVAKEKLTAHFAPKQHSSFERFQFWTMTQDNDEPIEKFLLRVQQKADKCSFGQTELECRQTAIIDKIIQNAPDDLRRKLLEQEVLTLDTCTKIVNAHQSVSYQAAQMNSKPKPIADVHRLIAHTQRTPYYKNSGIPAYKEKCSRCGRFRHRTSEKCPAADKKCHGCGNTGHFQSMCKTPGRNVRN